MKKTTHVGLVVVTVVAFCFAGCGGPKTVPVSGAVTFGGKPVANLHVCFQPKAKSDSGRAGPASVGTTDAQGRFKLATFDPVMEGAMPGEHSVIISWNQAYEGDVASEDDSGRTDTTTRSLPQKAYDGSVKFTVPDGGTDSANFEITQL